MEQPNLGAPNIRVHYVRVTNRADVPFTDRYDGIPVSIGPGKTENLPLDMASHMFGYGHGVSEVSLFQHTCKRQGWNTPAHLKVGDSGKTLAQELFGQLEIKPVVYKMVEQAPDLDAPIPADPKPAEIPDDGGPVINETDIAPLPPRRKAGAS